MPASPTRLALAMLERRLRPKLATLADPGNKNVMSNVQSVVFASV
jgi:hypothetical protein